MKLKFNLQVTPISWKATLGADERLHARPLALPCPARIFSAISPTRMYTETAQRSGPLCNVNLHLNQQQKAFSWPQKCQELGQQSTEARGKRKGAWIEER